MPVECPTCEQTIDHGQGAVEMGRPSGPSRGPTQGDVTVCQHCLDLLAYVEHGTFSGFVAIGGPNRVGVAQNQHILRVMQMHLSKIIERKAVQN